MNFGRKVKLLNIWNHLLAGLAIVLVIQGIVPASWLYVSLVGYLVFGLMGANVGLHRYLSHRSFKTSRFWDSILKWLTIPVGFGSPISWCALHRHHHVHSDTSLDIQDPKRIGAFKSWTTQYPPVTINIRLVSDLLRDPQIKFIHQNYFKILLVLHVGIFLVHPLLPLFALSIPAVGCFHGVSAIGVIPHLPWSGYRTHNSADDSRNSPLASLLRLGEGWHNNHHAFPSRYFHGEKWWEVDPSRWIIEVIRRRDAI